MSTEKERAEWAEITRNGATLLPEDSATLLADVERLERERDAYATTIRNCVTDCLMDGEPCPFCEYRLKNWHEDDCPALPALKGAKENQALGGRPHWRDEVVPALLAERNELERERDAAYAGLRSALSLIGSFYDYEELSPAGSGLAKDLIKTLETAIPALLADVKLLERDELERERDAYAALRPYILHQFECNWVELGHGPCICGLDDVLRAAGAQKPWCPRDEEWYTDPPLPCVCGSHQ